MTIELIDEQTYNELLKIQSEFKNLTYQNKGYDGINRSCFTIEEKEADNRVKEILSKCMRGFRGFQNFKIVNDGEIMIRFQYNYSYDNPNAVSFTGVGYLFLDELFKGFREN